VPTKTQFLILLAILTAASLLYAILATEAQPLPSETQTSTQPETASEARADTSAPSAAEIAPDSKPPVATRKEIKQVNSSRPVELLFSGIDQEIVRPNHLYQIESKNSVKEIVAHDRNGDCVVQVANEVDTVLVATFDAHLPVMIGVQAGAAKGAQFSIPLVPGGSLEFTFDSLERAPLEVPPDLWIQGFRDWKSGRHRSPGRVCPVDFGTTVDWRVPSASNLAAALPTSNPDLPALQSLAELIHGFMVEQFEFKAAEGVAYAPLLGLDERKILTDSPLRWDLLPAGGPYLWENSAQMAQALQPGQAAAIMAAEKARRSDQAKFESTRNWQGYFRIEAGQTTTIQLEKRPPGIIKGRLPLDGPDAIHSAHVMLARILREGRDVTPVNTGMQVGMVYPTAKQPQFEFKDLAPGEYRLTAQWNTPGKVFLVTQAITLTDNLGVDLGTLAPRPTEPVALTLGFKDEQGLLLDPATILTQLPDEPWIRLDVTELRSSDPMRASDSMLGLYTKTDVLAGQVTFVYGLQAGRWSVSLEHFAFKNAEGHKIAYTNQRLRKYTEVPLSEPLEFFYTVPGVQVPVEFQVHFPSETETSQFSWKIASKSPAGPQESGNFRANFGRVIEHQVLKLSLPTGAYQLFILDSFDPEQKPRDSWFACFDFDVSPTPEVHDVILEPGITVQGTLLDAEGSFVANDWAVFRLAEFQDTVVYPEIKFIGIPDKKGHFVLIGVPPGADLQDPGSKKIYQAHPEMPIQLIAD
jgi:hypothetical protein